MVNAFAVTLPIIGAVVFLHLDDATADCNPMNVRTSVAASSSGPQRTYVSSEIRTISASNVGGNDHETVAIFTPGNNLLFIPSSTTMRVIQNSDNAGNPDGYCMVEVNDPQKIIVKVMTHKRGASHAEVAVSIRVKLRRVPGTTLWPKPLVDRSDSHG